jgi:hypothetical protein
LEDADKDPRELKSNLYPEYLHTRQLETASQIILTGIYSSNCILEANIEQDEVRIDKAT